MATFKRIQIVRRVYESDYLTAQRLAKAYETFRDHTDKCCGKSQTPVADDVHLCWRGKELKAKVKDAMEKRYEDHEIPETT